MQIQAVLFDFDGVLGDTMEDNYRAWSYAVSETGIAFDRTQYFLLEGHTSIEIGEIIARQHELDPKLAAEFTRRKEEFYTKHAHLTFFSGVAETIAWCRRQGLKLACVTGGRAERIINDITKPFFADFNAVVTAGDYQKGKPDPEPYQKAAGMIGVPPSECVVVENAPLGIRSAKAAGMRCIAVATTLGVAHLKEADLVVERIEELAKCWPQLVRLNKS